MGKVIKIIEHAVVGLVVAGLIFASGSFYGWQGMRQLEWKQWQLQQAEFSRDIVLEKQGLEIKVIEMQTAQAEKTRELKKEVAEQTQKSEFLKQQLRLLQNQLNDMVIEGWAEGQDFENLPELYVFLATVDVQDTDYELPDYVCSGFGFHLMTKAKEAGYRIYPMLIAGAFGRHMRNFAIIKEVPQSLQEEMIEGGAKGMAVEIEPQTLCVWVVAVFLEDSIVWVDELQPK